MDLSIQATGSPLKATGYQSINGSSYSIYTGTGGNGSITIGYGRNNATAFVVGNAATNGTAASISTGSYTISTLKSFADSYTLGNIDIIARESSAVAIALNNILLTSNSVDLELTARSIVGNLSPQQQQQLSGFIQQLWNTSQPLAEFILGTMYQWLYDNGASIRELLQPLKLSPQEENRWRQVLPQSRAFRLGQTVGGGAAIVQGILEFVAGSGAVGGGGSLCLTTGVGCFASAPAIAGGVILQAHGASTIWLGLNEEAKLLRELLSPAKMESSGFTGPESLAGELGVGKAQIENALSAVSPDKIRQLHGKLNQETFEQLLKKDEKTIQGFSRVLDLAGEDKVASDAIAEALRLNKKGTIGNNDLKNAVSNLAKFAQRYQGKVFGDFASRFSKAEYLIKKEPAQVVQAQAEIKAAEDFLEGRTELGVSRKVEGLAESEIKGVKTPEFQVTGADGVTRLAEVKTTSGALSKSNINNNLKKAITQIKANMRTGEGKGYIRLDARAEPTTLTRDEISQKVKSQLLDKEQKGVDYVEFVEVLYKNDTVQTQKLIFRVQGGNIVIFP